MITEDQSVLEMISEVSEFAEVSGFFEDKDIDEALASLIKLIAKPNVPPAVAAPLVVQLQALSSKFALMGKYYMLYDTDETKEAKSRKKNTLLTLSAELEKLSNAVKYLVRT